MAAPDNLRLFLAIRRSDLAAVEELLDRRPDLVHALEVWSDEEAREARAPRAGEVPALVRAAERRDLPILRALVERGADVDQGSPNALWVAVAARYPDVVRYLVEAGADVHAARAESGHTPLHAAAIRGWDEVVEQLLAHGADPGRRDRAGRTPLDWARQNGHASAEHLLAAAARDRPAVPAATVGPAAPGRTPAPGRVSLTAAVMTHPGRLKAAEALRRRHPELHLDVVVDPRPTGRPSPLRTARVAWSAAGAHASHHLVLQDDVELCDGFRRRVEAAISAQPTAALCFFAEWGSLTSAAVRLAALLGASWAELADRYVPTQALVLPAGAAAGYDAFAGSRDGDEVHDDTVMRAYLASAEVPVLVAAPNLVEHADVASLMGHDVMMGPRRSAWFAAGAEREPGRGVTNPTLLPFVHTPTGQALSDVREQPRRGEWQRIRTERLLSFRGLRPEAIDDALAELGGGIEAAIGLEPARQLWLTAVALGVSLAELWADRRAGGSIDDALAGPGSEALATMPVGTLRQQCALDVLTRCAGPLTDLVTAGVRWGFASAQSDSASATSRAND